MVGISTYLLIGIFLMIWFLLLFVAVGIVELYVVMITVTKINSVIQLFNLPAEESVEDIL